MMRSTLLTLVALGLIAAPADAKDKKPADPNKKICRSIEVTGSIMGGRQLCKTRAEWETWDQGNHEKVVQASDPVGHNGGYGARQGD